MSKEGYLCSSNGCLGRSQFEVVLFKANKKVTNTLHMEDRCLIKHYCIVKVYMDRSKFSNDDLHETHEGARGTSMTLWHTFAETGTVLVGL